MPTTATFFLHKDELILACQDILNLSTGAIECAITELTDKKEVIAEKTTPHSIRRKARKEFISPRFTMPKLVSPTDC